MNDRRELKCAMTSRTWVWLGVSLVVLAVGAYLASQGSGHKAEAAGGYFLLIIGALMFLGFVATRRSRLVADETGLTFQDWRHARTISWARLSSLRYTCDSGDGGGADRIVVVNDMGRKHMVVPMYLFNTAQLVAMVDELPTRVSGRERVTL